MPHPYLIHKRPPVPARRRSCLFHRPKFLSRSQTLFNRRDLEPLPGKIIGREETRGFGPGDDHIAFEAPREFSW
jgi:hypothetical protein